ncbi:MAG TPA: TetR/AcrR family transcriptional regulator [Azospirillaceae bacterium]|nr:TetR/AcrR family transcriptional regulator [Azospirillaceae bacterium]
MATKGTRRKKQEAPDPIRAALDLAAERGWRDIGMADIAGRVGLSLNELRRQYPSKGALLDGLARRVDEAVLAGGPADADERPRDRLFDVMMRRFDALVPYREGLRAVARDVGADPLSALGTARQLRRSMDWMLETARVGSSGLWGMAQARGLLLVHLSVLRVWFEDDSPDLARTMAALDARLRQAEELSNSVRGLSRFIPGNRGFRHGAAAAE